MSIYDFYFNLQSSFPTSIILLEKGNFFQVYSHESDGGRVAYVCDICKLTHTRVDNNKDVSKYNPHMCGFNKSSGMLDKYVKMLIEENNEVRVVKEFRNGDKITRRVDAVYTPATYIDVNKNTNNTILCIYREQMKLNVINIMCSVDISTNKVLLYTEDDISTVLKICDPREILIYGDLNIDGYRSTYIDRVSPEYYIPEYINNTLHEYYPQCKRMVSLIQQFRLEMYPLHCTCLLLLLKYLSDYNKIITKNLKTPKLYNSSKVLRLFNNAIYQLNLIDTTERSSNSSIYAILNKCVTPMGRRRLRDQLLNPITNVKKLQNRYDDVSSSPEGVDLSDIRDIEKLYKRQLLNLLSFNELRDLFKSYVKIGKLLHIKLKSVKLSTRVKRSFCDLVNHIDSTYDFQSDNIFNTPPTELQTLLNQREELYNKLENYRQEFTNLTKDPFTIECKKNGYHITSTLKRCKKLRDLLPSIKITENASYGRIINDDILQISDQLLILDESITETRSKLYYESLEMLTFPYINKISDFIGAIDVSQSIYRVSLKNGYVRPEIIKENNIIATDIRHPILELRMRSKYIGNDVDLSNGMLIYGINCSGKSSYLRSIGISVILAQCGFFVPASSFKYHPFRNIYTKIAIQDNILENKSTFVNEMLEVKTIIENCDSRTLVLADELCSGTETRSAIGLVTATINRLVKNNSRFVFTTHFHELIQTVSSPSPSPDKRRGVKFYHVDVEYRDNEIYYTRKLREGKCISEYGIEVANFLGLDKEFIDDSKTVRDVKLSKYNSKIVVEKCELCNSVKDLHVHHIKFQRDFKKGENRNNTSNLIVLCEECHHKVHNNEISINGFIQTTDGIKISVTDP